MIRRAPCCCGPRGGASAAPGHLAWPPWGPACFPQTLLSSLGAARPVPASPSSPQWPRRQMLLLCPFPIQAQNSWGTALPHSPPCPWDTQPGLHAHSLSKQGWGPQVDSFPGNTCAPPACPPEQSCKLRGLGGVREADAPGGPQGLPSCRGGPGNGCQTGAERP